MNLRSFAAVSLIAATICLASVEASGQSAAAETTARGKHERVSVHGKTLEGNLAGDSADRKVSVYLPPSYSKDAKRRYPVVYLLHGYTDSDERWFGASGKHFVNVPSAADRAFANGAREVIIVMPNAFTKYQGSMYGSSAVTGDWETFITRDLVAYVDKNYRTLAARGSRGLAGHSMGGYGTLRLAMKRPDVFSSLYALSPCCMSANMEPSAEIAARAMKVTTAEQIQASDFPTKAMLASAATWSPNPKNPPHFFDLPVSAEGQPRYEIIAQWAANAPLAMVHQYIPSLRSYDAIVIDAGDKDVPIVDTVRTFDRILSDYGIAHTTEVYEGDHVNRIEQRLETKVLPFFGQRLEFE
jgi:S-formylglutathione hydrolase FrmB